MDQSECFLQENYEHSAGNPILIKSVFMHVCLLRKHERRVFKAYTDTKIKRCEIQPSSGVSDRRQRILAVKNFEFIVRVSFVHSLFTVKKL